MQRLLYGLTLTEEYGLQYSWPGHAGTNEVLYGACRSGTLCFPLARACSICGNLKDLSTVEYSVNTDDLDDIKRYQAGINLTTNLCIRDPFGIL